MDIYYIVTKLPKRVLAVAVYTGHECYSFAPKRSEVKAPLSAYF